MSMTDPFARLNSVSKRSPGDVDGRVGHELALQLFTSMDAMQVEENMALPKEADLCL